MTCGSWALHHEHSAGTRGLQNPSPPVHYLVGRVFWSCTASNNSQDVAAEQHLHDTYATVIEPSTKLHPNICLSVLQGIYHGLGRADRLVRTYRFLERIAIVHPEPVACAACKATVVLIKRYV